MLTDMKKTGLAIGVAVTSLAASDGAFAQSADVEALKAQRAELERQLANVDAQLEAQGVAAPAKSSMGMPVGSKGLLYAGTVEVGAAWNWADCENDGDDCSDLDDDSFPEVFGSGRVSLPVSDDVTLQTDIDGWATFTDRGPGDGDGGGDLGEDNRQTGFGAGLHATYRDPNIGSGGLFGQIGSTNGGEDENATFFAIGGEAQAYINEFTVYGQVGGFWADDETENDVVTNAIFFRGVGRWFPDDNSRVEAEIGYFDGEQNDSSADTVDGLSWGLRGDRMLSGSPVSFFAAYDGMVIEEEDDNQEYTEHRLMAGVTFHFNAHDMLTQDRRGVTLDMPDFARWIAPTIETVD